MASQYYTNIDINDEDYVVNKMFNSDGTKKTSREDKIYQKSSNVPPVKNKRKKRQKPKGMIKIAAKAIIFIALTSTITVEVQQIPKVIQNNRNETSITNTIELPVKENIQTYGYNAEAKEAFWNIDSEGIRNIADRILNENKEYDIDTRIYGAYKGLPQYEKETFMNRVFRQLSTKAAENAENLTDEELHACLFDTWQEYVESKFVGKDMTYEECLEEYLSTMRKVVKSYAKEDSLEESQDKKLQALLEDRQELLDDINLGGGSR